MVSPLPPGHSKDLQRGLLGWTEVEVTSKSSTVPRVLVSKGLRIYGSVIQHFQIWGTKIPWFQRTKVPRRQQRLEAGLSVGPLYPIPFSSILGSGRRVAYTAQTAPFLPCSDGGRNSWGTSGGCRRSRRKRRG